jgi:general secretion pathway protein G
MRRHPRRAFTLIELLLVLVILAVLAAVVVPNLVGRGDQAKRNATIADIAAIKGALKAFEVDNGRFPTTEEGLNALVTAPPDLANTWRKNIDKLPTDKYGHDYVYRSPGADNEPFDIISFGKDGQEGTEDDINQNTEK